MRALFRAPGLAYARPFMRNVMPHEKDEPHMVPLCAINSYATESILRVWTERSPSKAGNYLITDIDIQA